MARPKALAISAIYLALAWLLGVLAATLAHDDRTGLVAAALLLTAATLAWRPKTSSLVLIAIGIVLVFAGGWRYYATQPTSEGTVAAYNDTDDDVRLRGVVSDEPDARPTGRLYRIDVREVLNEDAWEGSRGKVPVRLPPFPAYEYGDVLDLEGELETPPTVPDIDFDYRGYLLRQGVVSLMAYPDTERIGASEGRWHTARLIDIRAELTERLDAALPEPQSSLAAGILLGTRADLPADLEEAMRTTGTSHLVAVSGQNVTLLAGLVIAAFAWAIGRRPAAFLSIAIIVAYALLVGGQASVVRASIMASIYVVSVIAGRQNAAPVGLGLAAAGMTALDPQVIHDIGFQLSFAATIGLVTFGNELKTRLEAWVAGWPGLAEAPVTRPLIETFAISLAAILFTLPITAVHFGEISLVALPANLLAVPAFLAVALTAAVALLAGVVPGGEVLQWTAWLPATYMIAVIDALASLPYARLGVGGLGTWFAVVCYVPLILFTLSLMGGRVRDVPARKRWRREPRAAAAVAAGAVLVAATAFVWVSGLTQNADGRLSVTFLDVGQGDAVLIEGPDGHRVLVDGGPSGDVLGEALGRTLPFFDRRIDLVVLTHPQTDHGGGLIDLLDRYDVGAVLDSTVDTEGVFALAWHDAVATSNVSRYVAQRGMYVNLGSGARLQILAPSERLSPWADPNDGSTVPRVVMGETSFLLTGDIEAEGEAALVQSGTDLRSTVLKVPHHGSRTSTSEAFLSRVAPAIGVISVGAENRFGHPAAEVLGRLSGDHVLRTDEHGDVRIETDGERVWVTTGR
ncbi:MAG TPA: DNA internalization-related competence protein ComEC/Rec2 [Dehalococcoidia bacterium]|nr:DNA internalization-related competence protein ComEC/Rec2 [Dehalococcoidia bacterium]